MVWNVAQSELHSSIPSIALLIINAVDALSAIDTSRRGFRDHCVQDSSYTSLTRPRQVETSLTPLVFLTGGELAWQCGLDCSFEQRQ